MLIKEKIIKTLENNPTISLRRAQKLVPDLTKSYFYKVKKEWKKEHDKLPDRTKNFSDLILRALLENPSGLTITDIADNIKACRNTVSKYIGILEAKKKVVSKEIGAYKLYFSAERTLIPKKIMLAYYTGLLTSIKSQIKNKEKFKEIGKEIAKHIKFVYSFPPPDTSGKEKVQIYKEYLRFMKKILTHIDIIYEKKPKVKMEIIENGVIFFISNIEIFEKSKELDYHYYIASGVIEILGSKGLKRDIQCDVEEIDVENKSVKLKIIIKD